MTTKKVFYLLSAGLIILLGLIGASVYFGTSFIESQSKKLAEAKAQTMVIEQQQISLAQAKRDIEKYSELNMLAKTIVPQDKDQAKTVREIDKIARDNGINLKDISFQTSNLGQAAPAAPRQSDGEGSAAPRTPVAPPTLTQVKPVPGINGVFALEIVISPADPISYRSFLNFLEDLEGNRRTAHVEKISINPSEDGRSLTFSLTLNAYVKP